MLFRLSRDGEVKELKYFIKVSKEFTRKGYQLIGVLVIELKRKIVDNEKTDERRIGRYIINLGAFLRSIRSGDDVVFLKSLGNLFASQKIQDVIIPIYYLPELKERLKSVVNDIREDLLRLRDIEEFSIDEMELKIASKKLDTNPSEVLADLMKIIISQYIDESEFNLLERDIKRLYGIMDEASRKQVISRWKTALNEILHLTISYSIILFQNEKFDKIKFLEALSKSLSPNKVKIALRRFILLARNNVKKDVFENYLKELKKVFLKTTLEGLDFDLDYVLSRTTKLEELNKYIKPNLKGFSKHLQDLSLSLKKKGDIDKILDTAVYEIVLRDDLSEDDKVIATILLTLSLKPSKLREILYKLKGYMLCEACPGARIIHLLSLALSKPSKKLLDESSAFITILVYSGDLKNETYKLYLSLAYVVKALIAKRLSYNNIREMCERSAIALINREKMPIKKILWSVLS